MKLTRVDGHVGAVAPFDFAKSAWFLGRFKPVLDEQSIEDGAITKAMAVDGQAVVFRARPAGSGGGDGVDYELFSDAPISEATKKAVADRISFFLSLDDDLREFYKIGQADGPFASRIEEHHGLHHVKFLTLCESGCWAPLAQHAPVQVARTLKHRLTEAFGCSLEVDGRTYWAFPELTAMAKVDEADMARVIANERKAHYVKNVVEALMSVDEEFLRTAPYDEAEAYLRGVKGVGQWSAAFILLRGLGRMEHMPLDLKPILKAVDELYGPGQKMQEIADRYGPWLGYWAFYLRAGHG
ncbi:MAG: DNA-3-methyladenine glycosylase [Acidimicrobiaceae bacterium]|jgi:DNA-3-methyladenine glycosylase II|nr:DNA-3-methyladenine glycosylase [Acidimicrobiaceae bacterium]